MRRNPFVFRAWFFLIFILSLLPSGVNAQDGSIKFCWGVTASLLEETVGLFSPPQVSEVYILSNRNHIFNGKLTYVYYWPLEREYKPDWSRLNQDVDGALEISDSHGEIIQTLEKEWYLYQQIINGEDVSYQLLLGSHALSAYQDYETRRDRYLQEMEQYDIELATYLDQQNKTDEKLGVDAPEKPAPFNEIMQKPKLGFVINMPHGRYSIQMKDENNNLVPDSQRILISVAPRRESLGLTVFPEARWTEPEVSYEARDVIYYTTSDPILYFQPVKLLEFNEREFARLSAPQETISSPNAWIWVKGETVSNLSLDVLTNNQLVERANWENYSVNQKPGFALGYQIIPMGSDEASRSDFAAFRVSLDPEISNYLVRFSDSQGNILKNSQRVILRASSHLEGWVVILLLFPVFLGSGLRGYQFFRKKQNAKVMSQQNGS